MSSLNPNFLDYQPFSFNSRLRSNLQLEIIKLKIALKKAEQDQDKVLTKILTVRIEGLIRSKIF